MTCCYSEPAGYTFAGPAGAVFPGFAGGFSFFCAANVPCFAGTSSRTSTGWTAGAGAEWRFLPNWSMKAEYLYFNLGSDAVTSVAGATSVPGSIPASYRASFGDTEFHIVRAGLNWHF
jgi:outer membrane immunogenic protein